MKFKNFIFYVVFIFVSNEIKCQTNYTFNSGYLFSNSTENGKNIHNGILGDLASVQVNFNKFFTINSYLYFKKKEIILSDNIDITSENNDIQVYPTITANSIYIVYNGFSIDNLISVQISDILGRILFAGSIYQGKNEIDVHNFNSGIYFININSKPAFQKRFLILK